MPYGFNKYNKYAPVVIWSDLIILAVTGPFETADIS